MGCLETYNRRRARLRLAMAVGDGFPPAVDRPSRVRISAEMDGDNKRAWLSSWGRLCVLALSLWFGFAVQLRAQEQSIPQMVRTSWTGRDGMPPGVRALAQTPDGILWIASLKGLYTFDGLSFARFQPNPGSRDMPPTTLRDLFVAKSGDLWVAGYHGPAVRIHQGQVTVCNVAGAAPNDGIDHLQQDSAGAMWAVAKDRELVRLGADDMWHPMSGPVPEPGHIERLFIDSVGTQWVIENDLLYRRPQGLQQFLPTKVSAHIPSKISEGLDHTLWIMALVSRAKANGPPVVTIQQIDQSGRRLIGPMNVGDPSDILPEKDGSLWVLKAKDELQHLRSAELAGWNSAHKSEDADVVKLGRGLGITEFHAFMRDARGAIWVGGLGGLERFAHATLVPAIPGAVPGVWDSCVGPRGDVFIVRTPAEFYQLRSGRLLHMNRVKESGALFCGPDGTLYMIANDIVTVRDGKLGHVPVLPGYPGYGDNYVFVGCLPMPDGSLIGAVGGTSPGTSLWLYKNQKWSRFLPKESFPETSGMFVDSRGTMYLGHLSGPIHLVTGNAFTTLPMDSAHFYAVLGFAETSFGVFAYGTQGFGLIRQGALQVFKLVDPDYSKGVTGVVQAQNGDIWINGSDGIMHIVSAEIRAALADPTHVIAATNLQEQDFKGPGLPALFISTAHIDPEGRLWFSTLNGVVSVDPKHLGPPHPPQLTIRAITADGSLRNARAEFPPNIATLDVQYFGVNLIDPRSVVYRYQLEGLDTGWQDVGHRTEAIYTHPRPGRYTFRVMASNGDGVWTAPVVSAPFTVLPGFHQTWWFGGLCLLTAVFLVWFAIRARVRYVSRTIRRGAEERADERIRIARELHDTLLQAVQGLLLAFHVAANKVPADHESKQALEKALSIADRIILEGRNRVTRLRSEQLTDAELKPSIEGFAADLNPDPGIAFVVERRGGSQILDAPVVEEIFCIAREALTNAFRHSEASRIVVELDYQRRLFKFNCRDNGRGFDSGEFDASPTNGHWGLRGMAERAEKIGAKFSCTSSPRQGTDVQVMVPARRAYARTTGFWPFSAKRAAAADSASP
jgi:signal transduction histidine kinase/ligand-binding sensor domain-containing protein